MTPFRAGSAPGIKPAATAEFTGAYTLLADVSEFQPDIADAAYLAWSKAIVIRAAYGTSHDDRAWYGGQRRDLLHAGGAKFVGIYQYLVAGQDGGAQAAAMARLAGPLRPGEALIADYEEGQRAMLTAWYNRMHALGYPAAQLWTYSGLRFGQASGVLPVEWIAAYGQAEPSSPHRLWQFTSSFTVPGVGTCDCSVFRGSIDELAALAYQPAPPPPVPQYPAPTGLSQSVRASVSFGWDGSGSPHWRVQVRDHAGAVVVSQVVTQPALPGIVLPAPGTYSWRVQAAGDSPFTPWREFTV